MATQSMGLVAAMGTNTSARGPGGRAADLISVSLAGGSPGTTNNVQSLAVLGLPKSCPSNTCSVSLESLKISTTSPDTFTIDTSLGCGPLGLSSCHFSHTFTNMTLRVSAGFPLTASAVNGVLDFGEISPTSPQVTSNPTSTSPGAPQGILGTPTSHLTGTINTSTGRLTLTGTLNATFDGQSADVTVSADMSMALTPTAVATAQVSACDPSTGLAAVTLDGTGSTSHNGQPLAAYQWSIGSTTVGTTAVTHLSKPVGSYTAGLLVTDTNSPAEIDTTSVAFQVNGIKPIVSTNGGPTLTVCNPTTHAIALPPPSVKGACSGTVSATIGSVVSQDNVTLSTPIPVVGGAANLTPGHTYGILWTVPSTFGNGTASQTITITGAPTLYAKGEVDIDTGATLLASSGGAGGAVYNSAASLPPLLSGLTQVDLLAKTGPIFSVPPVLLTGANVSGTVQSSSIVTNLGSTVSGPIVQNTAPILPPFPALDVTFPFPIGPDVAVLPGTTLALAPGAYNFVTVPALGTLLLSHGTYRFNTLTVLLLGQIKLDTSGGNVILGVQGNIIYQGSVVSNGTPNQFLEYTASCRFLSRRTSQES